MSAIEEYIGDRIVCGEDCARTDKCQSQAQANIDQLYYWLKARRDHGGSLSLSSMPARIRRVFFELYGELEAHLKRKSSAHLCDASSAYAGMEAVIPYFRRTHGRWLIEVIYHANRAVAELEDPRFIPDDILGRAIDIATALTLTTERELV